MNSLISIIIPTYNCGHLIDRCIRSIQSQTYQDFEIIIIDDKSPDLESIEIQKEWAKKESRINLILKPQNGGRDSRIMGLDIAKGKHICFMDQDDWMPANALEVMVKAMIENDAELVIGQVRKALRFGSFVKSFNQKPLPYTGKVLTHADIMGELYESYFGHNILPVSVWGKLYKKEILDRVNFPDPMPQVVGGDLVMSLYLHEHINKLVIIPDIVYDYLIGMPGSGPKYLNRWLPEAVNMFDFKWNFINEHHIPQAVKFQAIEMINYIVSFVSLCTIYDYKNREARIKELSSSLQHPIWGKISLLKEGEYSDPYLADLIVKRDAVATYELLEKRTLDVPFKTKVIYSLKRFAAKHKLFA